MGHRDYSAVEHYAAMGQPARGEALARLREHGFPANKDEAWYYTPTRRLLEARFVPVVGAPREPELSLPDGDRLVFVDGLLHEACSTRRVDQTTEARLSGTGTGFEALNEATFRDGADVVLTGGVLHLVHVGTGDQRLACPRHRIRVVAGASAFVVEHFVGRGGEMLTNAVTEVSLAPGARLDHLLVQSAPDEASRVHTVIAVVPERATYAATSVLTGGATSRVEFDVRLRGDGALTELAGLCLGRGRAHHDHHVTVRHELPRGTSRQNFRSILDDHARAVFTGKVVVARDAQKTDSQQSHRSLLLSDDAVANSRPQLEIDADDVVCSHGATVGQLDDESLFYLRQRGLSVAAARELLVAAFAGELIDAVEEPVRGAARAVLDRFTGA
jgi:Fe-S cluster assembly protein SufD